MIETTLLDINIKYTFHLKLFTQRDVKRELPHNNVHLLYNLYKWLDTINLSYRRVKNVESSFHFRFLTQFHENMY